MRCYEQAGLVEELDRNTAGYRDYGEAVFDRLRFIGEARRLGSPWARSEG